MKTSTQRVLTILLTLFSLATVGQKAQAVVPAPDGCYPNFTTAEGCNALQSLSAGAGNTGLGWRSLFSDSTGNFNTGVGAGALVLNNADSNTAVGAAALLLNTSGTQNTAVGTAALVFNDTGGLNTAVGYQALLENVSGLENTAMGDQALLDNAAGNFNVGVGGAALITNTAGNDNTAVGSGALNDTTGSDNTALGFQAGILATNGDGNVYIGAGMSGVAGESNQTYIRNINTTSVSGAGTDTVTVNLTTGLLGHVTSSLRYKEDIKPMHNASQALFALKPVTFRYKKEIDRGQILDYGLIAEQVAQVDSNLAIRDKNGQIESVRYSAINAMLLNEFLKEHDAFIEEQKKVRKLEEALATVNERLREQEARIEHVSAAIATNSTAPQVAQVP
jgi:trimeric autotransporter adhesin